MKVNGFSVYYFHHDDHNMKWTPIDAFMVPDFSENEGATRSMTLEEKEEVRSTLLQAGWEGDGDVEAIMVPPFFSTEGDNYWFPVYHVKQNNNGTSWIASKRELGLSAIPVK